MRVSLGPGFAVILAEGEENDEWRFGREVGYNFDYA